ncbi:hypothetical protein Elgi_66690 [Paenibacillus elgii]|uniref:hypothetical protein n=1 Tax=Paenibacillus elgii TaxID=189691 RepID=UPI002D7C0059|nr:hypothetical protein Elgi_66690 [Paenibacillus elgii]
MISKVKRIRSWAKYSGQVADGESVFIGLEITEEIKIRLELLGFESDLVAGRAIIPAPEFGRASRFNTEGKLVPQRDLPKETAFRQVYWEWTTWDGDTHSGWKDVPYQRYPRKLTSPPSEYLVILERDGKKLVVVGDAFLQGQDDESVVVHKVNLMLELFGMADILRRDLKPYVVPNLIKVHWELLPPGEMPWPRLQGRLEPVIARIPKGKVPIVKQRLEVLAQYQPEFVASGVEGYRGYLVFGFPQYNLFVLESPQYGNATYVFEGDWTHLSKLTKAEILAGNLHKHRVIHMTTWEKGINEILGILKAA